MKYSVLLTEDAKEDLSKLDKVSQNKITRSFKNIQNVSIDSVNTKPITKKIL